MTRHREEAASRLTLGCGHAGEGGRVAGHHRGERMGHTAPTWPAGRGGPCGRRGGGFDEVAVPGLVRATAAEGLRAGAACPRALPWEEALLLNSQTLF